MEAELQSQIGFYLTGKRPAGLDAIDGLGLQPALLARYRDLTHLRYDFPLVLVAGAADKSYVQCLSAIMDGVVHAIASDNDGDQVTKQLLRLEQEIRALVAKGERGRLSQVWDKAAARLAAKGEKSLNDTLARARTVLKVDGELVDCECETATSVARHAWGIVQAAKARKARADLDRLALKLSDILRADLARSEAGRSAASLKAAIGTAHEEAFDFEVMSQVLARALPKASLPETRRRRIQWLLTALTTQRFFAAQGYSFAFEGCVDALAAYRERRPKAIELAKAMAIARLEIEGEYKEALHDDFFEQFGEDGLAQDEQALFPDYLVCMRADKLQGAEHDKLMEMLAADMPVKVLIQTDDVLEEPAAGAGAHLAFAARSKQLANMAIALNHVYVVQSSASNLFQFRERLLKGMSYAGPALFNVFSGAGGKTAGLPPYLVAAAAMESRVFPAFTYDPAAGANWAARFFLDANPQVDSDWPVQSFDYEDRDHQHQVEKLAFTAVDFAACDERYAKHFARVPRGKWNASTVPVTDFIGRATSGVPEKIPALLMVGADYSLDKVLVDDKIVRAAERCRQGWHSLQELGGIHNSHAERLVAREKQTWEEERRSLEAKTQESKPAAATPPAATAPAPVAAAAPAEAEEKKSSDEPYIETPRCSSCNECTLLNNKMFVYNENKQAYIADVNAGTYAQLVEAAENCQVGIIHPGKPKNPNEAGLEELLKRAEAFA